MMWTWKQRLNYFGWATFVRMVLRRIVKGHWTEYIDKIGDYVGEDVTETAITGSPYSPLANGRLKKVIVTANGDAATALWNAGYFKLSSVSFGGVDVYCPWSGPGIKTAPAFNAGISEVTCDLAVKTGVKIVVVAKHQTADTPVTFEGQVFGVFQG